MRHSFDRTRAHVYTNIPDSAAIQCFSFDRQIGNVLFGTKTHVPLDSCGKSHDGS